jgi:SAM-dependent methyltransferase
MAEAVDYFTNHRLKIRFPWALYHRPIIEALRSTLRAHPGRQILNLGSGPFFELPELGSVDKAFTLADIDPRAIELAKAIHGSKLANTTVIDPNLPLPFAEGTFDIVVSMDVIEHVPEPAPWLAEATRVLRPGGVLFLTTPNYASLSLKLLEATALEAVARFQGFSRKNLHPSKMTPEKIASLLEQSHCDRIDVRSIAFGWVLAATAYKI